MSGVRRSVVLVLLAGVLWIASLVPWPGFLGYLDPAKPTLVAIAFALAAHRLGVASWPLVITFSLTFFFYSIAIFYFSPDMRDIDTSVPGVQTRMAATYVGALIFSPITLWGPVLLGCGAYAVVRRRWSNFRWSGRAE